MSSSEVKMYRVQNNSRRQVVMPQSTISATQSALPIVVAPIPAPANTLTPTPTPPFLPSNSPTPFVEITIVITTPSVPAVTSLSPLPHSSDNSSQVLGSGAQPGSKHKFNLLYLVPVFVALGILWGALAAWITYKWVTRRRKAQGDTLIGGPRYVPAPKDVEGGKSPQQNEIQMVTFSWSDLRQAGKESERHGDEDDPFLLPPSPTKVSKDGRTKSARSTTTTYSNGTYALEMDDEGRREDVPWESLRHKSIKRGILAEVEKEGSRINSLRPSGTVRTTGTGTGKTVERRVSRHRRTDSDQLISDIDQMLTGADGHASSNTRPPNYRADSAVTTLSIVSTTTAGDKTQWKPGRGFRIVEESPLSSRGPTPVPPDDPVAFSAPVRHDTSRSTSTVRGSTVPSTPARPHAHVLPQSPPQITSPLLENSLCFTPHRPPRALMSPLKTPTRRPDTSRKVRSSNQPQLPLPGSGDGGINSPRPDVYRGRLVKIPKQPRPPMTSKSSSSSTTYKAIKKVEDIVERSWAAREMDDEGARALSPTNFGKLTGN